ncbi:MAG: ATP-binding protein, partial [Myxococcales bacterium]
ERVVASVTPLAQKRGLALELAVTSDLGNMSSDRRRLEQIILNLLNNAIKFTERGTISVSAERVQAWGPHRTPGVRVNITDTGSGLKPEHLSKLFQPFSQIDTGLARQHEGTGLGLVICRRLARLLGGDIDVASEWSIGSTFSVTLPLRNHES